MSRPLASQVGLWLVIALAVAGCGSDDDAAGESTDDPVTTTTETATEPEGEPEPETTQPEPEDDPEPETTEPAGTEGETEEPADEESVTFASLSEGQQRIIDGICQAVEDSPAGPFSWGDTWVLSVLSGEAGVPAMEAAFSEVGQVPDPGEYLAGAAPVCDEIGWAPTG